MYHIVKEVHIKKKPLWLVDLLFQINPSLYREIGTKEDIQKKFNAILSIILEAKVRWHNGTSLLPRIQTVSHNKNQILIQGNRGIDILSFRMEPEHSSLNKKTI